MLRAEKGGSYSVDVALNYYSQWLVNSCGVYTDEVWTNLWDSHGKPVFRYHHNMMYTIPRMLSLLKKHSKDVLFRDEFFELRKSRNRGIDIRTVRPILKFKDNAVDLRFQVGTRTNGVDKPIWPQDLLIEVVE